MKKWTVADIPDQRGRRVVVTGANSGIGYPVALELARKGATVVLACRDQARGDAAAERIRRDAPGAEVEVGLIDVASLRSVRAFAATELARNGPLDLLINNAGVYAPAKRGETEDGFELQMGTNVLGHFALTALLLPALDRAAGSADLPPRVVTVASIAHKRGEIRFDDLQSRAAYSPTRSYAQSKLANLMLALELHRRLRGAAAPTSRMLSVTAHPGIADTNIFKAGEFGAVEKAMRTLGGAAIGALLNTDVEGALPTLYAATAPDAVGGGYYGPQGFQEMRGGDVGPAKISARARDTAVADRLWAVCEDLTGVHLLDRRTAAI